MSFFTPRTLAFFRNLERNNSRDWFTPRKGIFEEHCRKPMVALVTAINDDLRKFCVENVADDPVKTIYRIYRDTRFSKDKTPYKTHIGATFGRRGFAKSAAAGFYFGVSHKEVEIAGGMYMPGPEELAAVRAATAKDEKRLRKILADRELKKLLGELRGKKLARVPKGFAADHPAGDLLRMTQMYFYITLPASLATSPRLRKEVVWRFKAVTPFVNFINEAIVAATRTAEKDDDRPRRPAPMF